jgi:hypothetical protein
MPTTSTFIDTWLELLLVAALGLGIYLTAAHYHKRRWLQRYGVRTLGVVIRLETDTSAFEAGYYPVVRFEPVGHALLEARYPIGSRPAAYTCGETVRILYDPKQPMRFVIGDASGQGWAWVLAVGLVGAILTYCLQ